MKKTPYTTVFKLTGLVFLFVLMFSLFVQGKTLRKQSNSDNLAYAHLFSLVVIYDNAGGDLPDFLRKQSGLTEDQYNVLRVISHEFNDAFRSVYGKKQILLSLDYRNELKRQLGEREFAGFDKLVKEKIIGPVTVVRKEGSSNSASPEEFSYSSSIAINEGPHELRGRSITVTFSFAPSSPEETCSTSATLTGPGVSLSGSDSAGCFERTTSVTLISTAYQSNAQYCMNGSHSGPNGQTGTSSQCLTTPDTPRISSVVYEQILTDDLPIDTNPNTGGGKRIFPDKKVPGETNLDRRKISVKAQYYQATAGIRIYFRNFDVDDPSASAGPIDTNDTGGINGGNDNNGKVNNSSSGELSIPVANPPNPYDCQTFTNGTVSGLSCLTDANGVAKVDFTITQQPGDNFAVVAGTGEDYTLNLVPAADGINLKDTNNVVTPVTAATNGCTTSSVNACRADMLTVWRRVHLEVDSMGNVGATNNATGTINGSFTVPRSSGLTPGGPVTVNLNTTLELDRFDFGRLVVGSDSLLVVSNTTTSVTVVNATNRNITLSNTASFTLYDDDDYNADDTIITAGQLNPATYHVDGDNNENIVQMPESFKYISVDDGNYTDGRPKNIYASAYVRPEYAWAAAANYNQTNLAFALNVADGSNLDTVINANRNSINDEKDDFWIGYFLIAYQEDTTLDADGSVFNTQTQMFEPEPGVSGVGRSPTLGCDCFQNANCPRPSANCTTMVKGAFGSMIFEETMKDVTRSWLLASVQTKNEGTTAPHELGHQFGLRGDVVGTLFKLMDYPRYSLSEPDDYGFHDDHINVIRHRIKSPGE
jgi:hypothetical protein